MSRGFGGGSLGIDQSPFSSAQNRIMMAHRGDRSSIEGADVYVCLKPEKNEFSIVSKLWRRVDAEKGFEVRPLFALARVCLRNRQGCFLPLPPLPSPCSHFCTSTVFNQTSQTFTLLKHTDVWHPQPGRETMMRLSPVRPFEERDSARYLPRYSIYLYLHIEAGLFTSLFQSQRATNELFTWHLLAGVRLGKSIAEYHH
jgi:hypothetical protein